MTMSQGSPSSPLVSNEPSNRSSPEPNSRGHIPNSTHDVVPTSKEETTAAPTTTRSNRPPRACTIRAASRLYSSTQPATGRRLKGSKKGQRLPEDSPEQQQQCSSIVTPLVELPSPSQLPRWNLRSMWELASILNFLHVFRPLLNISAEFSAEEFETALLSPNDTLSDIHMPLLKAIPPITRMALTRDTWITVLCRKLRDWWHWVADGELPIVASHGLEIEAYKSLDPGIRVVILKALCDIRVEQEDIRSYIDSSLKRGVQLSSFRKERIGGDSHGISYWYEDDQMIGHRLYREVRKTEVIQMKKGKPKGSRVNSSTTYQWEAVATNFDEFVDVTNKLFSSKNKTEVSLGKKLKIDMLPEIEKVHKKKERLLKKQQREALLLDNFLVVDGIGPGRSLRGRKPVTYTFDDYDRSINEAIEMTKRKQPSPEPMARREAGENPEALSNGKLIGPSHAPEHLSFGMPSPNSPDFDDAEEELESEPLDRSNRRRQRPMRYSEKEFVEALSDNEEDFDSDDDIVGEAVYDDEYLRQRKQRKVSSSSEGDEEYQWDEENVEDDDQEDSLSISEDSSDQPRKFKPLAGRTRRETKLQSVGEIQSGLRRSKRVTRNRINYRQYVMSDSESESTKPKKSNAADDHSDPSENENGEYMMETETEDSDVGKDDEEREDEQEMNLDKPTDFPVEERKQNQPPERLNSPAQEEVEGMNKRRFLDLNELAPSSGFEDGPNSIMKDENDDY
ncbi:DDT domain-containing protein DDR4-like isoform X2 [Neltuma alba]|uniref:DDT domain-containing protein DDR4-like isoform X2 n=1 Tax=Neltuma alba TaxID=207710 RepID=UPI0010A4A838|nr:DDT domain-containing protein DDR4-like isoform X2 [Prosopis alba]